MQIIVNGLISGLTIALLALAFSIVYLPTRVFHVALGGIYAAIPFIAWACLQWGWPWYLQVLTDEYSRRAKLFLALQTRFDRLIDCIGSPPGWDFEARYKPTTKIERLLNIVFIEEAEKLWGVLCFYNSVFKNSTKELLELFWVSGNRETRLKRWLESKGINGYSGNNQDLLNALSKENGNDTAHNLLKKSRFNIPVAALFLAIPPPDSVYRCEVAFVTHLDEDTYSSVKRIWHFSDINFPEIVYKKVGYEDVLTGVVNKQKVLVGLITEPILRGYLKDDVKFHIKEKAEHSEKLESARRRSELFDLLRSPLDDLIGALDKTREHGQRLKIILNSPTKAIFAASEFVEKYFNSERNFKLGVIGWEVPHQPSNYKEPFAACAMLAAVVGTIFGKENLISDAANGEDLFKKTMTLLNVSRTTFKEVLKTLNVLLWYHGSTGEDGKDMEQQLVEYMSRVLKQQTTDDRKQDTTNETNLDRIKESLKRFKEILHTAWKPTHVGTLASLATIFYSRHTPAFSIEGNTEGTYYSFGQILINRRKHLPPFQDVELPVPTYGHLLNFLIRILEYVNEINGGSVTLDRVKLTVKPKKCCHIDLQFSSHVFNDMVNTFEEMKKALEKPVTATEGNFHKPFVMFCSAIVGTAKLKERDNHEFVITHGIKDIDAFSSSIYAKDDTFRFCVDKN